MSYLRYAARIYNCPLLVTSEKARVLESIVRAHEEGRASLLSPPPTPAPRRELAGPDFSRSDAGYIRTGNGVAIIQTIGTMVQRGGDEGLDAMSGLVAYSTIAAQMRAAALDPRVDAVLWEIDSEGGEVSGLVEAVSAIRVLGKKKPLWAIANEKALSAAMWTGTAATKLFVPSTGMVGSIGVRTLHRDESQRDAKQGYVYTEIVAGDRKADFSPHAPLSDAALQTAQEMVDRTYAMFVAAVADHRGIDEGAVRDTQAALLSPAAALAAGLIDGIQSFEETLAALTAEAQHVRFNGMRAAASARASAPGNAGPSLEGDTMTDQEKSAQAALIAEARAAGVTEGKTAATTEAVTATAAATKAAAETERKRIAGIQGCEAAKGKPTLAAHLALETEMTVEQATALLAKAAVETPGKPNPLAGAMPPNPKVAADVADDDAPKARIDAAKIYESRRLAAVK